MPPPLTLSLVWRGWGTRRGLRGAVCHLTPSHLAAFAPCHPGTVVTYPRVTWTTDLEGLMTSSEGAAAVPWRAWETRAQNLARGVRGEDIPEDPPWVKDKK